ncbi:MAG: hypothetical protein IPM71_08120 [Bacteroidota bacterium]|nr:MAG: hypothetical protein IPM71_08120 [Bacteroidota bacterium]
MASTTETGHAINVANLDVLISFVSDYGTAYNPSNAAIALPALQSLSARSKTAMAAVNSALSAYTNAIAAREIAFAPLSKFITRVSNALKASGASAQTIDSAKSLARKIQGGRASAKLSDEEKQLKAAAGKTVKESSASQMSYDNRLDNFDKLIKLLASNAVYAPNETELTVTGLTALYTALNSSNAAVVAASVTLNNARIARNEVLYHNPSGIYDAAGDAKAYVKSVFGASSPQFKQIGGLKFTNLR